MKDTTTRQLDGNILAVLHQAGQRWSALIADLQGQQPRILHARRFDDPRQDSEALVQWLDQHNVGEVLAVVPASSIICRTCSLPDVQPDELAESLSLQAEAHLSDIAPAYRTASAVLPAAVSESSRTGLLLAWPEHAGSLHLPELHRPTHYTADVAALAAMLDTHRSDDPLLWVDRHSDAVAMAISHANGTALRATYEGSEDDESLMRGVQRALAETAFNVGHSGEFVGKLTERAAGHLRSTHANQATLLLPGDLKTQLDKRLDGAGADNQWWSDYGVAAGAVLARHGSLAPLTTMLDAPPAESPSIVHRIGEQLAHPRTAAVVVTAAVLLLAFSPLVFNGLRLIAMKVRYNDIDTKLAAVRDTKKRLLMYEQLQDEAWPMTKLLGDVANCTPLGIELDSVRISRGQNVTVSGFASPRDDMPAIEVISEMERQLRETGIFTSVQYSWDDPSANGVYPFDLNAHVARPHRRVAYDVGRDFGRWTHEMRRNNDPPPGENDVSTAASGSPPGAVASADAGAERSTAESSASRRPTGGAAGSSAQRSSSIDGGATDTAAQRDDRPTIARTPSKSSDASSTGDSGRASPFQGQGGRDDRSGLGSIDERDKGGAAPGELPELFSEATIKTLSRQEALAHLSKVSAARNRGNFDDETVEKLKKQHEMLMARLQELRGGG